MSTPSTDSQTRQSATTRETTRKEQAMWLLDRLAPGSAANNLSLAFRVDGRLQPTALRRTIQILVGRHEALRTVYLASESELGKRVTAPGEFTVPVEEITVPGADPEPDMASFVGIPFRFDGSPMLRAGLFHGERQDSFCLAAHHLVFDTASAVILLRDLTAVYEHVAGWGDIPAELLAPVPALSDPEPSARSLDYWHAQLDGFDPDTVLLSIGTPEVAESTLAGGHITRPLSDGAVRAVGQLRRELSSPEAVVLLAAYYALLAAHGAGPDIVVGSPVDTRPPGASGAVGYHVNVLPLRVHVHPERSFADLVRAVREVFLDGLAHADVPVDDLYGSVPRTGQSWRSMLFRHLFNYVPAVKLGEFTTDDMSGVPLVVENGSSKFDLEFFLMPSADGMRVRAVYGTEFLAEAEVAALLERYEALLEAAVGGRDLPLRDLAFWSAADRAVIGAANDSARPLERATVIESVRARALAAPLTAAVVDGDRTVNYRDLWAAAEAVRGILDAVGVAVGDIVAIVAGRGPELAAGVLGVWLRGAVYLPVDPDLPTRRIGYELEDSGTRLVLAGPGARRVLDQMSGQPGSATGGIRITDLPSPGEDDLGEGDLAAAEPGGEPGALPDPASPAYLMYTSGSTGLPKGTLVAHQSLANVIEHFARQLRATPGEGTLWLTTFGFDISGLELYLPLTTGGHAIVAPDAAKANGTVLAEVIARHQPRVLQATPTTWRSVLGAVVGQLRGRLVLCGGEPAPASLVRAMLAAGCEFHHVYGPTETTIWSTSAVLDQGWNGEVHVGAPIANTTVTVTDAAGRALPPGVRGELCIGGIGVALGYHNRPELTAERFGTGHGTQPEHHDPGEPGRFYRTGDVARWTAAGVLELSGRGDRQVKIRGNRVELGEIENVVLEHPRVRAAAVVITGDVSSDAAVVAFVEADAREGLEGDLWDHAAARLPRALIPQAFVVLAQLPVNASGKIDYPALATAAAERVSQATSQGGDAPEDELVATLIRLWRKLLERDDVIADTNFFMHGGQSLLGALLVQELENTAGITIRLADLFAEPTPARLAEHIRESG
jgi:amino acid adenylation domain-containing protein